MDRHDRAADLRHALRLSALSIVWSGVVGSIAVYVALASASLASLAASEALGLWWADAIAALIVSVIVLREGWSSLRATATA